MVTICFNAVATIEQALSSVWEQKYPVLEYIIIDGGSADGTLAVIGKYEEKISRFISEPDEGVYDAFNKGVGLATGEVVGILNADDFYAPWTLQTVAEAYAKTPDADVFYGKIAVVDEAAKIWSVYPLGSSDHLCDGMSLAHPAVFVPRRTYEKYGVFDKRYKIAGDWDFLLRLYLAGAKFCPIDNVLTAFRTEGLSSDVSSKQIDECRRIRLAHLSRGVAFRKNARADIKFMVRKILKATGLYDRYAAYRDRALIPLEARGSLTSPEKMWEEIAQNKML